MGKRNFPSEGLTFNRSKFQFLAPLEESGLGDRRLLNGGDARGARAPAPARRQAHRSPRAPLAELRLANSSIIPPCEGRASVREGGGRNHSARTTDKPAACAGPNGARHLLCPLEMLTDRSVRTRAFTAPSGKTVQINTQVPDGHGVKGFPLGGVLVQCTPCTPVSGSPVLRGKFSVRWLPQSDVGNEGQTLRLRAPHGRLLPSLPLLPGLSLHL